MSLEMTKKIKEHLFISVIRVSRVQFLYTKCSGSNDKDVKYPTHLLLLQISWLFEGDLGQILLAFGVIYMYIYQSKM